MDPSALPALLLPAAAVLLARVLTRRGREPAGDDSFGAIAIGVSVPAALFLAGIRPAFPLKDSDDAWQWLVWLAPAGALLGVLETSRLPRWVRWGISPIGCGLAGWLLLAPLPHPNLWAVVPLVLLWDVATWPEHPDRRRALSASVATAAAAAPAILVRGAHSFVLAAVSTTLAAGFLAALVARRGGVAPFPKSLCGLLALGFGAVLLAAQAYGRVGGVDGFPAVPALALGAAAVVGGAVPPRAGRIGAPLWAAGAALALAALSAWASGAFDRYEVWW